MPSARHSSVSPEIFWNFEKQWIIKIAALMNLFFLINFLSPFCAVYKIFLPF
jgi:hypothetical protein